MPVARSIPPLTSEHAKRHRLLQQLHRRGEASRLRLARELRISNSRVCDLVDKMVLEGLLDEDSAVGERRGRRGVTIRLNPSYGHLVGLDMEAKRLRLVLTDFTGQVVWETRKPIRPPKDQAGFLDQIFEFVDAAIIDVRARATRVLGFGIAASGVIDLERGVILHYDLIPHATNLPLRDLIARRIELPCCMENNIRAMTLAEWTLGAARGLTSFVCMSVRSGVGPGVVIDGRIHSGSHGFAGETGYMVLPGDGPSAEWKNLQQTVSETALGIDIEASGVRPARAGRAAHGRDRRVAIGIDRRGDRPGSVRAGRRRAQAGRPGVAARATRVPRDGAARDRPARAAAGRAARAVRGGAGRGVSLFVRHVPGRARRRLALLPARRQSLCH